MLKQLDLRGNGRRENEREEKRESRKVSEGWKHPRNKFLDMTLLDNLHRTVNFWVTSRKSKVITVIYNITFPLSESLFVLRTVLHIILSLTCLERCSTILTKSVFCHEANESQCRFLFIDGRELLAWKGQGALMMCTGQMRARQTSKTSWRHYSTCCCRCWHVRVAIVTASCRT